MCNEVWPELGLSQLGKVGSLDAGRPAPLFSDFSPLKLKTPLLFLYCLYALTILPLGCGSLLETCRV